MYVKRLLSTGIIVAIIIFSGCNKTGYSKDYVLEYNRGNGQEQATVIGMMSDDSLENTYEIMFEYGSKHEAIENSKDRNEVVITVNGLPIYKSTIEMVKVDKEIFGGDSIKEKIDQVIINKILESEAKRLGIKCTKKDIAKSLEALKMQYSYGSNIKYIQGYLDARNMSVDEYIDQCGGNFIATGTRVKLRSQYLSSISTEVEKVKKTSKNQDNVENEYWEKYKEELVKKAEIKVLDEDVMKMLERAN